MDSDNLELGSGLWRTEYHVGRTLTRVMKKAEKQADFPPAVDMQFCNCYI